MLAAALSSLVWLAAASLAAALAARLERRERLVLLGASVLFALSAVLSPPSWAHDQFSHFRHAREAFANPLRLLDAWDRPAFVLLYAVPARLGLVPARLTSLLPAAIAVAATIRAARALGQPRPWLAAVFLVAQLDFFGQASSTMTELLFAAGFAVAVWGWADERPWLTAAGLGYLSLARPEGPLYAGLGALALLARHRRLGPAGLALAPFAVYLVVGAAAFHDPTGYVTHNPYRGLVGLRLDPRELLHSYFFVALRDGQPAALLLLEAAGAAAALRGRRRRFLLAPLGVAFLLLTFLRIGLDDAWRQSRYLVAVAPALALLASAGLEAGLARFPRLAPAVVLVAAAVGGTALVVAQRRTPALATPAVLALLAAAAALAVLLWRARERLPLAAALPALLLVPLMASPAGSFAGQVPTPGERSVADAVAWLAEHGDGGLILHEARALEAACAARLGDPCPLPLRETTSAAPPDAAARLWFHQGLEGAPAEPPPPGWREAWRASGARVQGPLLAPRTLATVTVVWTRAPESRAAR